MIRSFGVYGPDTPNAINDILDANNLKDDAIISIINNVAEKDRSDTYIVWIKVPDDFVWGRWWSTYNR